MPAPTDATAAIHYIADGFSLDRKDLKGRHSAGAGFLGGIARCAEMAPVHCYAVSAAAARHCAELLGRSAGQPRPVAWIPYGNLQQLSQIGCLFQPDPTLIQLAWMRRQGDQRAFSLCGLTHTICSAGVLKTIGEYLTSPLQPWDALICTSQAARRAILLHLEQMADFLAERTGGRPTLAMQLPVIPLGVHCDRFATADAPAMRRHFRERYGIAEDEVAVLFFGRLAFHAKAHPLPMLAAVEMAGRSLGRRLHFLFVGRFPNPEVGQDYHALAATFAPNTTVHFVPGEDDALAEASWHGADLFLSLSDNIQETFGLTPIEAMAAGLPAVVSDWDGYRDTVADGETGFRIPTLVPPAGDGEEMSTAHMAELISYDRYIGAASLATSVDISACAAAIGHLAGNPELRHRMADAARQRARTHYDWSVVVRSYRALWGELATLRRSAGEIAKRRPGTPAMAPLDDPFRVFGGFASTALAENDLLWVDDACLPLETVLSSDSTTYMQGFFLPAAALTEVVRMLRAGPLTVGRLTQGQPRPDRVRLGVLWLLKFGIIRRRRGA